jgi:hypothetical protein
VTNFEREDFALYRNEGENIFLHVSDIFGINKLGGLFVGFGTACEDFDLDGDEDIIVNNGHITMFPSTSDRAQVPLILEQRGGRFNRVQFEEADYLAQPHVGRGLALFDFDRDGDSDVVFSNLETATKILRNDCDQPHNEVQIELVGRESNRNAIGATATLTVGEAKLVRLRKGGSSYLSTNEAVLSWGLGASTEAGPLVIQWPSGRRTVVSEIAVSERLRIVEPSN